MKFKVDIGLRHEALSPSSEISFYDYCEDYNDIVNKIEHGYSDFVSFYGGHDGVRREDIVWYKIWRLEE